MPTAATEDRRRTCADSENFKSLCRRILKALTPGDRCPSVLRGACVILDAVSRAFSLFTFFFYLFLPVRFVTRIITPTPWTAVGQSPPPPPHYTNVANIHTYLTRPRSPRRSALKPKEEKNSKIIPKQKHVLTRGSRPAGTRRNKNVPDRLARASFRKTLTD